MSSNLILNFSGSAFLEIVFNVLSTVIFVSFVSIELLGSTCEILNA